MISSADSASLSARGDPTPVTGVQVLTNPLLNKGTAFTERERDALGIRGLLPPRVFTLEEQLQRTILSFRAKPSNIDQYIYLTNLQNRNEVLFYRLLLDHIEEMVPIIYTPTVGEACLQYPATSPFQRPRWPGPPACGPPTGGPSG